MNYDLETVTNIIDKGLRSEDMHIALQAAQAALLHQIHVSLYKIYKHGIDVNTHQ